MSNIGEHNGVAALLYCRRGGRRRPTYTMWASPSGVYTVSVEMGPVENGVETWVAAIRDNQPGAEVFRDTEAYSSRHGVGITWLSTTDQLWLLSGDVGPAHVDRRTDGTWTKTYIYPETVDDIPDEIAALESH